MKEWEDEGEWLNEAIEQIIYENIFPKIAKCLSMNFGSISTERKQLSQFVLFSICFCSLFVLKKSYFVSLIKYFF